MKGLFMTGFVAAAVAVGVAGAGAAETYSVDPVHSAVVFKVKHANTGHSWGRFNDVKGTFRLDAENPANSELDFTVKAESVDTNNKARDKHLMGPDFFNVAQYPEITFRSKTVEKSGKGYKVTGTLTFHGVSNPLTLEMVPVGTGKDMRGNAIAGVDTVFSIKQSDFGIPEKAGVIGDEVTVFVSLEGIKK